MVQRRTVAQPRPRILYVDDEPAIQTLGKRVLGGIGYDVDTASDGTEAWAALQEVSYHLLITDHHMPRLTGLELARRARLAGMRLPIVISSGSADILSHAANSRLALVACLPKPFGAEALVEMVEQVLRIPNDKAECVRETSSVVAHMARVQPYHHGGINE